MPVYTYKNKKTKEIKDVMRPLSEYNLPYLGEDGTEEGLWDKMVTKVNFNTTGSTSNIDPYDKKAFLEATREKEGTLGDLYDLSKELSDKRKSNEGVDPVKEGYKKDYKSKTGKDYLDQSEPTTVEHNGIKMEFD